MTLARRPAEKGGFSTLRRSRKPSKRSADPVTPARYVQVMVRDRACIAHPVLGAACGGPPHVHHRLQVRHGGASTLDNLARLCQVHHSRVHNYPVLARSLGLLLRRGEDPATVPVMLVGQIVLLNDDGTYQEVEG